MIERSGVSVNDKKALVLGSGGASATAVAVLEELGANVIVISRSGINNYLNLDLHSDAAIIVNATPVGMYPNTDQSPINLSIFPNLECVLDLIYNPSSTRLLQQAQARGLKNQNGLWMLVAQAKESAEWFLDSPIPDSKITEIFIKIRSHMENIVLIGMPGCGKTTIGKMLAQQLGRPFWDADEVLVARFGTTIPEIFASNGEDVFRNMETMVLSDLGKTSGSVISTGGGCVTRAENYPILHQNSKTIWIQRDIDNLATSGRPLSQANNLSQMYQTRKPLYESFCDYAVNNDGAPEDTVKHILRYLQGGSE